MLFDRTLVLDPEEELRFVVDRAPRVALTIDGRELGELGPATRSTCTGGARPARLVDLRPRATSTRS